MLVADEHDLECNTGTMLLLSLVNRPRNGGMQRWSNMTTGQI
jgi:hypothetical protein